MKTITAVVIISFFSVKAFSQGYQKFAVEGAHWQQYVSYAPNAPDAQYPYASGTEWFKLEGDTLIDTLTYKMFYKSSVGTYHYDPISSITSGSSWQLWGLVREDTLTKRVFLKLPLFSQSCGPTSEDTLLYDFGVGQHDSMIISYSYCPDCCRLDSFLVDTIFPLFQTPYPGYQRKTWNIAIDEAKYLAAFQVYEGIGASFGFFGSPGPSFEGGWSSHLQSYCIGPDSVCGRGYIYSGINNDLPDAKVVVFPNPVSDRLFISGAIVNDVQLFSSDGKQVAIDFDRQSSSMSLAHLNSGIYFLFVKSRETLFRKKIIKL